MRKLPSKTTTSKTTTASPTKTTTASPTRTSASTATTASKATDKPVDAPRHVLGRMTYWHLVDGAPVRMPLEERAAALLARAKGKKTLPADMKLMALEVTIASAGGLPGDVVELLRLALGLPPEATSDPALIYSGAVGGRHRNRSAAHRWLRTAARNLDRAHYWQNDETYMPIAELTRRLAEDAEHWWQLDDGSDLAAAFRKETRLWWRLPDFRRTVRFWRADPQHQDFVETSGKRGALDPVAEAALARAIKEASVRARRRTT